MKIPVTISTYETEIMVSYGNTMLTDFHFVKFQVINHIIKYKIEACPKHKTRWVKQQTSF
jgi:hypothetical protein